MVTTCERCCRPTQTTCWIQKMHCGVTKKRFLNARQGGQQHMAWRGETTGARCCCRRQGGRGGETGGRRYDCGRHEEESRLPSACSTHALCASFVWLARSSSTHTTGQVLVLYFLKVFLVVMNDMPTLTPPPREKSFLLKCFPVHKRDCI